MVDIRAYYYYWKDMVGRIPNLEGAYLVATEAQLQKKVSNIADYPIIVATIPSADPDSKNEDNTGEKNTGLIFVLKKVAESDRTDDSYIDDMARMQTIMKLIKEIMLEDKVDCEASHHEIMRFLDENSFHQDPEYNYLGHDGWSLSFRFGSSGY